MEPGAITLLFVGCILRLCNVHYLSALLGPHVCPPIAQPRIQTLCIYVPLEVLALLIHSALESEPCLLRAGDFPTLAVGT